MSKCHYPNCQYTVPPKGGTFCEYHYKQYMADPTKLSRKEWVEAEWARLAKETPYKKICMYPDCRETKLVDSNKYGSYTGGLCQEHRDMWGFAYIRSPFDWCVSEYERLHEGDIMPEYACACNGCGEQRISGSDFCCTHSPSDKDFYINAISDLINVQINCAFGASDNYNRGLLNGLKCALSCITGEEPEFVGPESEPICNHASLNDSILVEADRIVNGERASDYGDAIDSFSKISTMASTMANRVISPLECCLVLKAVKLVRQSYKHKRDNLVDECGYAELESRITEYMMTGGLDHFMKTLGESVGRG